MTHDLKIWPAYFCAVWNGSKTFEVRKADRLFEAGDKLRLREWNPDSNKYTNNEMTVAVSYVLANAPGVELGWAVLAIHHETANVSAALHCDQPGFSGRVIAEAAAKTQKNIP